MSYVLFLQQCLAALNYLLSKQQKVGVIIASGLVTQMSWKDREFRAWRIQTKTYCIGGPG